eukprot:COSAG01_NODE_12017_length_1816_cov_1.932440_2_plen_423_part_01
MIKLFLRFFIGMIALIVAASVVQSFIIHQKGDENTKAWIKNLYGGIDFAAKKISSLEAEERDAAILDAEDSYGFDINLVSISSREYSWYQDYLSLNKPSYVSPTEVAVLIDGGANALVFGPVEVWESPSTTIYVIATFAYILLAIVVIGFLIRPIAIQQFEIDFLMLVAAIGAAVLGNWAEGALLLFLFSLSHALEHLAMGKARHAIESLASLAPDVALVRRNQQETELLIADLKIGDIVIVKPNERVPADGLVIKGQTSIDQSPITGESLPVEKNPVNDINWATEHESHLPFENRVFAGTINQHGAIEILVTRLATETALARVVLMVNEQSETQRFAQKFERIFVPVVLIFVGALLFAWVIISESAGDSFYRAMAVLVAASPCALAISTPSAVLSGVARAARGGVLIKGGGPLEELGKIKSI